MAISSFTARSSTSKHRWLFAIALFIVVVVGIAVRVADFPMNPPGFNQDEASAAYEAFCLLHTGADRWGHPWPAYFPSWGSGQNVLLSYLTIPAIKAFGLSVFSARLPMLVLGILTLLVFAATLRPLGRYAMLLGALALAVVPWHVMLSRWALESNAAPSFMLAGCAMVAQALATNSRRWIVPSLLPFVVALYGYGTTIVVLPVVFALILLICLGRLRAQPRAWLLALALALLVAAPFLIFFAENYILHRNLPWTDGLPFSTPLLPSSRLDQVSDGSRLDMLRRNARFILAGFDDGTVYNRLPGFPTLFYGAVPLAILSFLAAGISLLRARRGKAAMTHGSITLALVFAWAVGALLLTLLFDLNINRFNHFFLPALILMVWMVSDALRSVRAVRLRGVMQVVVLLAVAVQGGIFLREYFTDYPRGPIRQAFNAGLEDAFKAVPNLPEGPVLVSQQMPLAYMYTAFFTRYPPAAFQRDVRYSIAEGTYRVTRLGRFFFEKEELQQGASHGYLLRRSETSEALPAERTKKVVFANEDWEVGFVY